MPAVIAYTYLIISSFWFNSIARESTLLEEPEIEGDEVHPPNVRSRSSEENTSTLGKSCFMWIQSLLVLARRRAVSLQDLSPLSQVDMIEPYLEMFWSKWNGRTSALRLAYALWILCYKNILCSGLLRLVVDILSIGSPLILQQLILFLKDPEKSPQLAVICGVALAFISLGTAFAQVRVSQTSFPH